MASSISRENILYNQRDALWTAVTDTIETLVRGDEIPVPEGADPSKPPDPNPFQSVIDRLRETLAEVKAADAELRKAPEMFSPQAVAAWLRSDDARDVIRPLMNNSIVMCDALAARIEEGI